MTFEVNYSFKNENQLNDMYKLARQYGCEVLRSTLSGKKACVGSNNGKDINSFSGAWSTYQYLNR